MGFNQRNPPDRTICVAVDLSVAFDTACHNNLLSKINISPLPLGHSAMAVMLTERKTCQNLLQRCKIDVRKVSTGVSQYSNLSPSLFSFYIADMPIPTEPVKRVCYADDLTVWATGVKIPDIEDSINSYLEEITTYLKDSLLISVPKYTVTLFSPDSHQATTHPRILIEDSQSNAQSY